MKKLILDQHKYKIQLSFSKSIVEIVQEEKEASKKRLFNPCRII